jgi:hypothetical protein
MWRSLVRLTTDHTGGYQGQIKFPRPPKVFREFMPAYLLSGNPLVFCWYVLFLLYSFYGSIVRVFVYRPVGSGCTNIPLVLTLDNSDAFSQI